MLKVSIFFVVAIVTVAVYMSQAEKPLNEPDASVSTEITRGTHTVPAQLKPYRVSDEVDHDSTHLVSRRIPERAGLPMEDQPEKKLLVMNQDEFVDADDASYNTDNGITYNAGPFIDADDMLYEPGDGTVYNDGPFIDANE
jgi:hypothetical protein